MTNKSKKSMHELWQDSYLTSGSENYIEQQYEAYLLNKEAVSEEWQQYFEKLNNNMIGEPDVCHAPIKQQFHNLAKTLHKQPIAKGSANVYHLQKQERVFELILAFRRLGHLRAEIDPLNLSQKVPTPNLELAYYGFSENDLNSLFNAESIPALDKTTATLKEIYQKLYSTYCSTIGFEYMHLNHEVEVTWLRKRIEGEFATYQPSQDEKKRILDRLVVADGLEKYLGFKYVGQKRFSLEGGDTLIPMMDTLISHSASYGVKEAVIGMAHRGRLNVLINVVGKHPKDIFSVFEGKGVTEDHSGDVKYHLGASANVKTQNGVVHVALAFNPSHLEIVSPVVQGSVRSRQRRRRDTEQKFVLPIQIHGDAAFAGQGVVMETFNMSQTRWFTVGGTIHIIINNQIGFTISDPKDSRSTIYCTDIAKMVEAPILHVNANDANAVHFAACLAIEYREKFKKDIVIDLVCYRRHGHNEADEPSATQPIMYQIIKKMPPTYQIYAEQLMKENLIQIGDEKKLVDAYREALDSGEAVVDTSNEENAYEYGVSWTPYIDTKWNIPCDTSVPLAKLQMLARELTKLPTGFVLQGQVKKMMDARKEMTEGTLPLNWGYAETLAYASLLDEGYPIRLCGQDACRGTFAHRHAVLHDQKTNQIYIPLSYVSPTQAQINLVDSFLSEEGVLAFEYGYATAEPKFLVIWEAQFGDFANGAQVVIDQFISSGEQKWSRLCGIVLLLPHGYEGQGPEHSSARLERYLQLCSQDNMQVCVPTTPAQIFHLLRRQMKRPYRKPLIVISPKSLLRHPLAISSFEELTTGAYQLVIPEKDDLAKKIERVVFTSGKIYYELLQQRREKELKNIALIRIEQLYPFPFDEIKKQLSLYADVKDVIWCQEEPQNQGAWNMLNPLLTACLTKNQKLNYVGRKAAASPAVGYLSVHVKEQQEIVNQALKL